MNGKMMLLGMMVLAWAGTSFAAVLFQDDFESAPAVSEFVHWSENDFNPAAQVGSWIVNEGFTSSVQVTSDVTAPQPGPVGGSNYLGMSRMMYSAGDAAHPRAILAAPATGSATVSFDLYFPDLGAFDGGSHMWEIYLGADAAQAGAWTTDFAAIKWWDTADAAGAWTWDVNASYQANNWIDYYPLNAWGHVDIKVDFAAQTYTTAYNGTDRFTSPFYRGASQLEYIQFWTSPLTDAYIDNVLVTPEPVTMVLLGLGGLTVLRRRR